MLKYNFNTLFLISHNEIYIYIQSIVPCALYYRPYPSWEMQTIGDCSSFQFIQSMEIDPNGRMWMADNGYVGKTRNPLCPPKMYIIDLERGRIIKVRTAVMKIGMKIGVFLFLQ